MYRCRSVCNDCSAVSVAKYPREYSASVGSRYAPAAETQTPTSSSVGGTSYPHGHQHIPVLVLRIRILGPHLPRRLRVLELQSHLALVAQGLQEVQNVAGVEAHHDGVPRVRRIDSVFALAGFRGVGADRSEE